jgi:hypothetical protein
LTGEITNVAMYKTIISLRYEVTCDYISTGFILIKIYLIILARESFVPQKEVPTY